ncbi:ABC transporter ATP-binding protein [Candidatus Woesebacteria bacterium RIFCSPHIGHO2_01_FULL_41_10]|uniref:ABC transporter ATP-binding protein n=1 Tax=Candidatus Woesebacteria bacterium RIFCSPHIGHO2_01_FULL_41_10 TaxID=1802500 RepID=A0A1F7YUT3_9BACT|nr:MAG: ABC transporter ATP-binding protein [Candidatus Woesebacteria bacterium RIFCSPHIGHO2_01_FULL_41_10]
MIQIEAVSKVYKIAEGDFYALRDVNLTIKPREYVGILGTSGSGKSTLMHIIGLLDRPTTGRVIISGKDTAKLKDAEISSLRRGYIGFVFQQFNLIQRLTVLENVLLPTQYVKEKLDFKPDEYARELLEKFGIPEKADTYPNKLSGGQQQRVAIARALVMKPDIVLADEPTGNLDSKTGEDILKLLGILNKEIGVTVVVVTHDKHVADKTRRQVFVRDGTIVKKY